MNIKDFTSKVLSAGTKLARMPIDATRKCERNLNLMRNIRLGNRDGVLIVLALGFAITLICPVPDTTAVYVTAIGGAYLVPILVGYLSALGKRLTDRNAR